MFFLEYPCQCHPSVGQNSLFSQVLEESSTGNAVNPISKPQPESSHGRFMALGFRMFPTLSNNNSDMCYTLDNATAALVPRWPSTRCRVSAVVAGDLGCWFGIFCLNTRWNDVILGKFGILFWGKFTDSWISRHTFVFVKYGELGKIQAWDSTWNCILWILCSWFASVWGLVGWVSQYQQLRSVHLVVWQ